LIRYQFTNHLDSSTLELDEAAEIISYEEYYPYGSTSYESVRKQVEVSPKRYRYTGKERDNETGFYYHGARYCAPWLGRWISCDPAGMVDGTNLYAYVRNNPLRLVDPNGRQSDDKLHDANKAQGNSADKGVANKTASDGADIAKDKPPDSIAKKSTDIVPPITDPALGDPAGKKDPKPDKPNLYLASVYQGIGTWDHPGFELETNFSGALIHTTGLGQGPRVGGGLNTLSLAVRKSAEGMPDNTSFDIGATGGISYLSVGGANAGRFPNAASLLGTLHYGAKNDNDWGFAVYGSGGAAWSRNASTNQWYGATYGGSGTLVLGHEPDEGLNFGFNVTGSGQNAGQLTQGPTLSGVGSVLGVGSVSGDVGPVNLSGELYGGYAAGGGTTSAAGGTGQSASAWNAGAGVGVSYSKVGPITVLDEGTPKNQTNTISFNVNYWHQSGEVQNIGTSAPSGRFSTDTVMFTVTIGFRQPPQF
jgi:RHS repeat-associated protein